MFMTTAIKCHSLSYVIFNAKMTLFEMSLLWARVRGRGRVRLGLGLCIKNDITERMTLNDSCHKHAEILLHIHDMCHVMIMKVSCQTYAHPFK